MPILSKLNRCFVHGLKICMWFGYSPKIFFGHFFHKFNLAIFQAFLQSKWIDSGYLVCATPPTVLCWFFWNFTDVFFHGLKICMWFGYSPQIIFCHFFHKLNLAIFSSFSLSKSIDSEYLVFATPPTVLCRFFGNFTGDCVMVWRYACGLDIVLRLFFSSLFLQVELFLTFLLSKWIDSGYLVCATPPTV